MFKWLCSIDWTVEIGLLVLQYHEYSEDEKEQKKIPDWQMIRFHEPMKPSNWKYKELLTTEITKIFWITIASKSCIDLNI